MLYISAIVVRFLTGRYLTEYAKQEEATYERNVTIDDKQISIKITDIGGKVCISDNNQKSSVHVYLILTRHNT